MVVNIPRTLETPPRTTGDPLRDLPLLVDWFYRAYQVITQSVDYINGGSLSEGDNVSLLVNDAGYIGLNYYALENDLIKFSHIVRGITPAGADDLTTKNYVDVLFASSAHSPVTVTDSSEIDFTLAIQNITASIKPGSISSGRLDVAVTTSLGLADTSMQPGDNVSDLTNDAGYVSDLSDYAFLPGRSGGQTLIGGTDASDDLILSSTSHGTKGNITIGSILIADEANSAVGIGTSPAGNSPLHITGLPTSPVGLSAGEVWNNLGILSIA